MDVGGYSVDLSVKFCISKFEEGHLLPHEKLDKVIAASIKPSNPAVADLGHIWSDQELVDVKLTLSNKGCFDLLCHQLNLSRNKLQNIKLLNLASNEITNLKPLSKLCGFSLFAIDLCFNKISELDNFQYLKTLNLQELFLNGNPVTNVPMFMEKIKEILPTLKKIDGQSLGQRNNPPITIQLQFDDRSEPIRIFDNINVKIFRQQDINDHEKKEFPRFCHGSRWTKVVVLHAGKVSKDTILQELNHQFFNRIPFYPCYYTKDKKTDWFYLRQNFVALNTLIQTNLSMDIPALNCKVNFEVHLNCAEFSVGQINWSHKINYVIRKRFKDSKLDLDNFSDDFDLTDLDVTLSTVSTLAMILKSARAINPSINTITMQNNKIHSPEGLTDLDFFPNLVSLDLQSNCLKSFDGFPLIPTLLEVNLDKNPLCASYYNEPWKYVQHALKFFPNLQFIDGRKVDRSLKPVVSMQNFYVSPTLYTLTESFVKFFFELYDSASRNLLSTLYYKKTIFGLMWHTQKISCIGDASIIKFFVSLPQTQHDFTTMCIDVPWMTETKVLIHVNGFFKEIGDNVNDDDKIFQFRRTFLLERTQRKSGTMGNTFKYCITNEQVLINLATKDESRKAFVKTVVTDDEIRASSKFQDLLPVKSEEEEANVLLMKSITKLNEDWCKR